MSKALVLVAGGLDSILAVKLLKKIKMPFQVVHFDIGLTYDKPILAGQRISKYFGLEELIKNRIEIDRIDVAKEFYSYLLNVKFSDCFNACLEYRVFLLKKAKKYMEEKGLDFIVTGDVVNQRILVQGTEALKEADNKAGVNNLVFRPLSALLLKNDELYDKFPFLKEIAFDFQGFSDQRYNLAKSMNIQYSSENVTLSDDKIELDMGRKAFEIFEKNQTYHVSHLNRVGQHFKLGEEGRLVVGRTPFESNYLKIFYERTSQKILAFSTITPRFFFGFIYKSEYSDLEEELSLKIFSSVVSKNQESVIIDIYDSKNNLLGTQEVFPISQDQMCKFILHVNDVFCPILSLNINK